jgi:transcriptional regulator with XRE-family HTH domain
MTDKAAINSKKEISGRQIAAARLLTGVSRAELAAAAGIPVDTLKRLEASGSAIFPGEMKATVIRQALENFGVIFLFEEQGIGAGVRLKFTRLDTRQIGRLENEGGVVREDDVP